MLTSPCQDIELPKLVKSERPVLTAEQVVALAEAAGAHYRPLIYTAAIAGLRAGELHALQRRDVDLVNNVIYVRRAQSQDEQCRPHTKKPKTSAGERKLAIPQFLADKLNEHLSDVSRRTEGPDSLVFTSKEGEPIRQNNFARRYFAKARKAGLPAELQHLRFHDLRHTARSLASSLGVQPKVVQVRLGHASITTTMDRYGHVYPADDIAVASALDVAFQSVAQGAACP